MNAFANSAERTVGGSLFFYAQTVADEILSELRVHLPDVAADPMTTLSYILPLLNSAQLDKEIKQILVESRSWSNMSGMREAREQLRTIVA